MPGEDVWSFISYAHDDNLPTGGGQDEEGFVSFLQRMLEVKLKDLGAQEAKLWRDAKRFSNGDPYDVEIEDALKKSALLIIVMSRNWLKRPYCLKELNEFVRLRTSEKIAVEERIVVVCKQYVPKEQRPAPLQVQEGFAFFDRDSQNDVDAEKPFFDLGKACDSSRYFDVRNALAALLQKRVQRISTGGGTGTSLPPDVRIAAPTGRTVYLAKPAVDMEQAYNRLALELQGRGYSVVPDVSSNIPNANARDYVDKALKASELSIHLIGEKSGFAPDDDLPRIVKLQLMQARERAASTQNADRAKFRRVVWAPKVLETGVGGGAVIGERDPIDALSRFDQQSPSDMIEGDVINKFLEALFQYLAETAQRREPPPLEDGDAEVFLDFNPRDDDEYGLAIASALSDRPISIVVPVAGEAAEARAFNQNKLAKCQGVMLCWSAASEVWVRAEADRLYNWRDLGREKQFARCSLVVGPPPVGRKKALNVLFRKNQFDKIVDLSDKDSPTGDMLIDVAPLNAGPPP